MSDHYHHSIEPIDVIEAWGLDFKAGNVIKYIARYQFTKNPQDLKKAENYLHRINTGQWLESK